jgi:hypothetical protein
MAQVELKVELKDEPKKSHYQKYKEQIKANSTKWMRDNREEANKQARQRYANNPELREKLKARARERAQRIREEKLQAK